MPESFIVGEVAHLTVSATDLAGQAADPGAIVLKLKSPTGTVTPYIYGTAPEVVRDGAGLYHADISLTAAGQWAYRWELTTPNAGAAEGVISVQRSYVL